MSFAGETGAIVLGCYLLHWYGCYSAQGLDIPHCWGIFVLRDTPGEGWRGGCPSTNGLGSDVDWNGNRSNLEGWIEAI